ncbi:hypothetical protein PO909_003073 [Leuciscus waleckii]
MEQSGAWVQLSQKPEGINLQERVVTITASGVLAAVAASANPAAAAAANLLASYANDASTGAGHPAASLGGFTLGSLAAATGATNGYLSAASPLVASSLLATEKLTEGAKDVVEIAVPENLVGAILGKGGKTLVEYQELTGARIQISKKGEFVPGTRNRKVTITGSPAATQAAQYLISQRITYEQGVRATNPQKVAPFASALTIPAGLTLPCAGQDRVGDARLLKGSQRH